MGFRLAQPRRQKVFAPPKHATANGPVQVVSAWAVPAAMPAPPTEPPPLRAVLPAASSAVAAFAPPAIPAPPTEPPPLAVGIADTAELTFSSVDLALIPAPPLKPLAPDEATDEAELAFVFRLVATAEPLFPPVPNDEKALPEIDPIAEFDDVLKPLRVPVAPIVLPVVLELEVAVVPVMPAPPVVPDPVSPSRLVLALVEVGGAMLPLPELPPPKLSCPAFTRPP
ncbi:hypothetical protein MKL09_07070 [Methylobacterium sp. J-048]|uniref:hypothetical protein n=1 Tax=Methylobacterium sp. J-048 TaxID=2836635 RepID=UPI001FB975BF|nr:hypothetical protein [Methylobacterium sp. J-048]MCJ2056308.1 hypothetical protein [Methylobacterium sp. J-048]